MDSIYLRGAGHGLIVFEIGCREALPFNSSLGNTHFVIAEFYLNGNVMDRYGGKIGIKSKDKGPRIYSQILLKKKSQNPH